MTQKSILSFFLPKNNTPSATKSLEPSNKEVKECSADDSPVKITNNRKRLRIHSSGSENELENDGSKDKESNKKNCQKISPNKKVNDLRENLGTASFKRIGNTVEKKNTKDVLEIFQQNKNNDESKLEGSKNVVLVKKVEEYDPNKSKYHPVEDACWRQGEKVPYYALAKTFEQIEKESARLKMMEIFSNYVRSVIVLSPEDLLPSLYLTLNRVGPSSDGLELGIAEQTLIRAISQTTGRTTVQIKSDIQEIGDIGLIAEKSKASQKLMFKPAPLTVTVIFKKFVEIAKMTGKTTVNKKLSFIENLLVACQGPEAKYLIRSLNGKLRIGLAEQTMLQALALACAKTPPGQSYPPKEINAASSMSSESFKSVVEEFALTLKTTYCECPNYDLIIPVLLKEGISALPKHCKVTPGLSMKPMLAQPSKGVQEVLTRFDGIEFTCEFKYDGERAQIHCCENGEVKIFSRNQEDFTSRYPDIISKINQVKKDGVTSFILDCEAVAWDKENSEILPFQVLTTRKRKAVLESEIKVPVCVFMFDLLYLNGTSLVREKFFDRRRLLHENFNVIRGEFMFPSYLDISTFEEVQEFLEQAVRGKCEGLMVKTLKEEATYEIAKRSRNWLKLKKDYLEGVGDTLDLVPLGGYFGRGKRTGTYGGFLVGCYDPESEEYQTICKLGSGFTEECLASQTEFFKKHVVSKAPSYYQHDSSLEPDQWFKPVRVWEIKCADLSLSPVYRAAIGVVDPGKGISLRFPRFIRVREDKKPEEATTSEQVMGLYCNQEQVKAQLGKSLKFQEEDFY